MYGVRLTAVHARGDTSRPSARRMLTKGTYVLRLQASTTYLPRKSGKMGSKWMVVGTGMAQHPAGASFGDAESLLHVVDTPAGDGQGLEVSPCGLLQYLVVEGQVGYRSP